MSQAETLLNSLTETIAEHEHTVIDTDTYFVIDPIERTISNGRAGKNVIMQGDHNSERFTFELPRYVEGHDMSLCNRVLVHWNNIDGETGEEIAEATDLYDLHISPTTANEEVVLCSWLISRNSTQKVGMLSFLVEYQCVTDGEITYEWHTDIYSDITVKGGRNNGEESIIEYTDILEQWRQRIFGSRDSALSDIAEVANEQLTNITSEGQTQIDNIKSVSENQISAIQSKGEETLATIPDDYSTTYNMAEEALRRKADAILLKSEGESIFVDNASDSYLLGLNVYGKTEQNSTPSPEYPQSLINIENPNVDIIGKNLVPFPYYEQSATKSGITFTVNDDGTMVLNGTATAATSFIFTHYTQKNLYVKGGQPYFFKALTSTGSLSTIYAYVSYNGGDPSYDVGYGASIVPEEDGWATVCVVVATNAGTLNNVVIKPQLEIGIEATEYEPYVNQRITIPHTLLGVPVSSGGNYTDSNGQKWICDEIDFERGVYVHRLFVKTISDFTQAIAYSYDGVGTSCAVLIDESAVVYAGLCSHFLVTGKATGVDRFNLVDNSAYFKLSGELTVDEWAARMTELSPTVIGVLTTPTETPLTDEEIALYKALKTNYPKTTVLNNDNAYMKIEYAADTLIYLRDNQPKPTDEQVANAVNDHIEENGIQVPSDDHIKSLIDDAIDNIELPEESDVNVSWNDLLDKPFYEDVGDYELVLGSDTITYCEAIYANGTPPSDTARFYKVSNDLPTKETLAAVTGFTLNDSLVSGRTDSETGDVYPVFTEISDATVTNSLYGYYGSAAVIFVYEDGVAGGRGFLNPNYTYTFPEKGVYVNTNVSSIMLPGCGIVVEKIDEKFISSNIVTATVEEIGYDENEDIVYYASDKTFIELKEAHNAGKIVRVILYDGVYNLAYINYDSFGFSNFGSGCLIGRNSETGEDYVEVYNDEPATIETVNAMIQNAIANAISNSY